MGRTHDVIDDELAAWVRAQHVFFVATAPLAADGHVNCSPKGLDTLRVLGPRRVGYLDVTGSGAETAAHLRENGRIVVMLCAFEGAPNIVRFHGTGRVVVPGEPAWAELAPHFPELAGVRSIVDVSVERISSSCGFGVPEMAYVADRERLPRWAEAKGPEGLAAYQASRNAESIDGLPAFGARR